MSLSIHTAAQGGFFGPLPKAAMPGHRCVAAWAGESSYPVPKHIVLANSAENPLGKCPASNSANKNHTLQEQMDSYWTGAHQRELVSSLLLQRAYTENTDQEIKLLDKPSTQLMQLVKNIKDISTWFPYSLLPPGQHLLLYHSPKQLPLSSLFFSTCHGQSGDEAMQ